MPKKLLIESNAKLYVSEKKLTKIKALLDTSDININNLNKHILDNQFVINLLKQDTAHLTLLIDQLKTKLNKQSNETAKKIEETDKSNSKLSKELQKTQEQFLKKEDELKTLETKLIQQEKNLTELSTKLQEREARVNELETLLNEKNQKLADIKKKLQDALLHLENKGLSINQKNGNVYISLDESLLFASGKTSVESKGVEALKFVSKVLEDNPDISITIEGHTDDVPMVGSGDIKDNWDLSVMRATAITKILLKGTRINPNRIIASGRASFLPLDTGKGTDVKKKNRRTEIILTPKLDELMKVLND